MSNNCHNFIERFAEPSLYEELKTTSGMPFHISIRGRRAAVPFAQIEALSIDEYSEFDLSVYELVLIELRDPTNANAGVVAHMVLRPDGKAFEIIDHGEHIDYGDYNLVQLLFDATLNQTKGVSDGVPVDSHWFALPF